MDKYELAFRQYLHDEVDSTFSVEDGHIPFPFYFETVPRGTLLTDVGDIETNAYLLLKGKVKVSIYKADKSECILNFFFPGQFFTALISFMDEEPTDVAIVTMLESTLVVIKRDDIKRAADAGSVLALRLMLRETYKAYKGMAIRVKEVLANGPRDLFKLITKKYRKLLKEVRARHLAAYMSLKEQSLWRLRKDLKEEGFKEDAPDE